MTKSTIFITHPKLYLQYSVREIKANSQTLDVTIAVGLTALGSVHTQIYVILKF